MTTLELLQLQNEHKDNFFGKGEDFVYEKCCENKTQEQEENNTHTQLNGQRVVDITKIKMLEETK